MINTQLTYEEEDALKRVLRHHGALDDDAIVRDLSTLITWVKECEKAKFSLAGPKKTPPLLFTVLSGMGIYGKEAIDHVVSKEISDDRGSAESADDGGSPAGAEASGGSD